AGVIGQNGVCRRRLWPRELLVAGNGRSGAHRVGPGTGAAADLAPGYAVRSRSGPGGRGGTTIARGPRQRLPSSSVGRTPRSGSRSGGTTVTVRFAADRGRRGSRRRSAPPGATRLATRFDSGLSPGRGPQALESD